jgi:hypothetical protein
VTQLVVLLILAFALGAGVLLLAAVALAIWRDR